MQLAGSNVVVAASQFNPSVLSQLWLARNGILDEGDFLQGSIYTDLFVSIQANGFHLLVVPQQLQFTPQCGPEEEAGLIAKMLGRLVATLPHTPYRAVGLNFTWLVVPEDGDVIGIGKKLFYKVEQPLFQVFSSGDARFGGYLSKDVFGCRLKLDVKPISLPVIPPTSKDVLQFAFNFNLDLAGETQVEDIHRMLGLWGRAKEEAQRIVTVAIR